MEQVGAGAAAAPSAMHSAAVSVASVLQRVAQVACLLAHPRQWCQVPALGDEFQDRRGVVAGVVDIIQNAIELAHIIGIPEPKVAILSAVETVNPKIQSTLDAAALCKMADRGQIKGGILDGPLAFDNAVSLIAAKTKGIKSAVAGHAEILVVPDLESGNMIAKQLEYLANALTAGIVLGTKVPIVLTSRADSAETRTASCVIAALIAHHNRKTGTV